MHPCLPELIHSVDLGILVVSFAGLHAARSLEAGARTLLTAVERTRGPVLHALAKIYVLGGMVIEKGTCRGRLKITRLSSAECFFPAQASWQQLPAMSQRRDGAMAAALAGSVYVLGGASGKQALNCGERFDPSVGSWEVLPVMSERRAGSMLAVMDGRLYVCGGFNGQAETQSVECFSPV
ncbi:unnamed protein product, partial [Polarella glacialis]